MQAVTIREAKARLNELVEAARRGEQIVLLRGSKHVAMISPISAEDIELSPRLTDAQAARLWEQIASERQAGRMEEFASMAAAVGHLRRRSGRRKKP